MSDFFSDLFGDSEYQDGQKNLSRDSEYSKKSKKKKKKKHKKRKKREKRLMKQYEMEYKKRNENPFGNHIMSFISRALLKIMFYAVDRSIDKHFDSTRYLPSPSKKPGRKDVIYTKFLDGGED